MKAQIQKWGNSLALRIPKSFAVETNIEQGSTVEISLEGGRIVIEPVTTSEYTLDELLEKVTKKNIHQEINTGSPQGEETGDVVVDHSQHSRCRDHGTSIRQSKT